jgi:hypothetical protein
MLLSDPWSSPVQGGKLRQKHNSGRLGENDKCRFTSAIRRLRTRNSICRNGTSDLMLERALEAIIRRVKRLDREHDIPYLAGYSVDGTIIYIDRHMPTNFLHKGRVVETDRFLVLHEEVEKTMIDRLNVHYLHAHQIATRVERDAVVACGINWNDYDDFMQANVKYVGDKRLSKVPADLDLKPYRDEHDTELLERMARAIGRGHHPASHHPQRLHTAVHATLTAIKANGGAPRHFAASDHTPAKTKPKSRRKSASQSAGKAKRLSKRKRSA